MFMRFLIKLLGGYTKEDVVSLQEELAEWDDKKVLQETVKELFNTIGEDDILKEIDGKITVKGKPISEQYKGQLIVEAQTLMGSKLWQVLKDDLRYRANITMFERSKTEQDLIAGKILLFLIDSIKTRLESLSKGSGRFNSDAK